MGMNVAHEQADSLALPRLDSSAMKIICAVIAMYIASLLASEVDGQQPSAEQKAAMQKMREELMAMQWGDLARQTGSSHHPRRQLATQILKEAPLQMSVMRGLRAWEKSGDAERDHRIAGIIAHHSKSTADLIPADELYDMLCDKGPMPYFDMYEIGKISFSDHGKAPVYASGMTFEDNKPFATCRNITYQTMQAEYRRYILTCGEKGMNKSTIGRVLNEMSWKEFLWTVKHPYYQGQSVTLRQPKHWMPKFERTQERGR